MIDSAARQNRRLSWIFVFGCLVTVQFVGCGGSTPTGTVKGKVLLDGQPYSEAAVAFISLDTGQAGVAQVNPDATFQLTTPLPVGSYRVYLEPPDADAQATAEQPKPVAMDKTVPEKYWNEASTDITIDITEGENDVTVELKSS
jgi:hypothetical protein